MLPNSQNPKDLVTFTEEILNGKLHSFAQSSGTITFANESCKRER